MSWGDIAAVVGAICAVAGLNLGGLRWLLDRRDKKQDAYLGRMDTLDRDLGTLSDRVTILERGPDWDTMNELRRGHARMEGELKHISATVEGMKTELGHQHEAITRIETHLLESKS